MFAYAPTTEAFVLRIQGRVSHTIRSVFLVLIAFEASRRRGDPLGIAQTFNMDNTRMLCPAKSESRSNYFRSIRAVHTQRTPKQVTRR